MYGEEPTSIEKLQPKFKCYVNLKLGISYLVLPYCEILCYTYTSALK